MKTVNERDDEAMAERQAQLLKQNKRHERWCEYLDEVEALKILVYVNDATDYDATDYDEVRSAMREHVRHSSASAFIDTACNGCQTVLLDSDPCMTLTSEPPKFWATCIGCGARYALATDLRRYVREPPPRGET